MRLASTRLCALLATALLLGGCGGPRSSPPPPAEPTEPVTVTLYTPCVLGGPLRKVTAAYESKHPKVQFAPQTYKPSEIPAASKGPTVVITAGDLEMVSLVRSGVVNRDDARTFAINTYPLAVVTASQGETEIKSLADLARPSVKHLLIDDPMKSSLGAAAKQGLEKLGLWEKVRAKAVAPQAGVMVLSDVVEKKADAAIVFRDCLLEGGSPPKTIRIVGEIPLDLYPPIPYRAAALGAGPQQQVARAFVDFLTGEEGKEALRKAGLKPN